MRWQLVSIFVLAASLPSQPPAPAAEPARPLTDPAELFSRLDHDHNGLLTKEEIEPGHAMLFRRLLSTADADHDGSLSREEWLAGLKDNRPARPLERLPDPPTPEEITQAMFRRYDNDRNGKLEEKELPRPRQAEFRRLLPTADKDGDKALSRAEFLAVHQHLIDDPPAAPPATEGPDAAALLKRLKQLDVSGDGQVDRQEAQGPLKNRFDKLDADGNGLLDQSELKQAAKRLARAAEDPQRAQLQERLKKLQDNLKK